MSREIYVPYEYTSYYVQRFGLENETFEHHEEMMERVNKIDHLVEEFIIRVSVIYPEIIFLNASL